MVVRIMEQKVENTYAIFFFNQVFLHSQLGPPARASGLQLRRVRAWLDPGRASVSLDGGKSPRAAIPPRAGKERARRSAGASCEARYCKNRKRAPRPTPGRKRQKTPFKWTHCDPKSANHKANLTGPVLGCIEADVCNHILILQHFFQDLQYLQEVFFQYLQQ